MGEKPPGRIQIRVSPPNESLKPQGFGDSFLYLDVVKTESLFLLLIEKYIRGWEIARSSGWDTDMRASDPVGDIINKELIQKQHQAFLLSFRGETEYSKPHQTKDWSPWEWCHISMESVNRRTAYGIIRTVVWEVRLSASVLPRANICMAKLHNIWQKNCAKRTWKRKFV